MAPSLLVHHQPAPVAHPGVSTFHYPAGGSGGRSFGRAPWPSAPSRPLTHGDEWASASLPEVPTELPAVVAFVRPQGIRPLPGTARAPRHTDPVHHIQGDPLFTDLGPCELEGQGDAISIGQEMCRAPLALPPTAYGHPPFCWDEAPAQKGPAHPGC